MIRSYEKCRNLSPVSLYEISQALFLISLCDSFFLSIILGSRFNLLNRIEETEKEAHFFSFFDLRLLRDKKYCWLRKVLSCVHFSLVTLFTSPVYLEA